MQERLEKDDKESNRDNDKDGQVQYGEGIPFERIRRITGYLVGDYRRMNDAKQHEVEDRLKHG